MDVNRLPRFADFLSAALLELVAFLRRQHSDERKQE